MALQHIEEVPSFKMDGTEFELLQIPEGPQRSAVKTYLELKKAVTWGNELIKEMNNTLVPMIPQLQRMIDEPQVKERWLKGKLEVAVLILVAIVGGVATAAAEHWWK